MIPVNRALGIDVSGNNGHIDWSDWKGRISFAEIKATESLTFEDAQFETNWVAAAALGLHRFAYHFGHPGKNPASQAAFFSRRVKQFGLKAGDQFVLDLEVNDSLPPSAVSFWARTFCHEMNRLNPGHRIIVQTFPAFARLGNCALLGAWHLWTMNWDVPKPELPVGPWHDWALWQHHEGTNGSPDLDTFNGTPAELTEFCHTTGKTGH